VLVECRAVIGDPNELTKALEGTVLGGRPVEVFDIPQHDMAAFAVAIAPDEVVAGWTAARGLLEVSGRWPVATASWNLGPVDPEELFNRVPYEASSRHDAAPLAVLARAEAIDPAEHIAERVAVLREDEPIDDWIDHEVGETYAKFGVAPSVEQVQHAVADEGLQGRIDLDRWLFSWELANVEEPTSLQPPDLWYQEWYQPSGQQSAIVFLPTPHPWETLGFMSWWASELAGGNEPLVAVLQDWYERFGAELVAHWGTMLQIVTSRRPSDPEAAWYLALEHELIAPYTLHQFPVREHARTLLQVDRWLLHERP
jgi:hypothetical protein